MLEAGVMKHPKHAGKCKGNKVLIQLGKGLWKRTTSQDPPMGLPYPDRAGIEHLTRPTHPPDLSEGLEGFGENACGTSRIHL
jgi:hypothetical protein